MELYTLNYFLIIFVLFVFYWLMPLKIRKYLLLIYDLLFYFLCDNKNIIILIIVTLIAYVFGLFLRREKKRWILFVGISLCIIPLLYFKYINYFFSLLRFDTSLFEILVPIGISYYTFEIISYLVDIYNGVIIEIDFVKFISYAMFFPTIVSGPIKNYDDFCNNKYREFKCDYGIKATKMVVVGLFNKIVISNALRNCSDVLFNNVEEVYGFSIILCVICYAFQIYCDFLGYSEIARGVSLLFGFNVEQNFNNPYLSTTNKEFWRRWHISLSTWLKKYIYIPLGGNRKGKFRKSLNLLLTFIVSAIWHGVGINFLLWGVFHWFIQTIEHYFDFVKNFRKTINIFINFVLICMSWILFRCRSLEEIIHIFNIKNILVNFSFANPIYYFTVGIEEAGFSLIIVALILIRIMSDIYLEYNTKVCSNKIFRYIMFFVMILAIAISYPNEGISFIYAGF